MLICTKNLKLNAKHLTSHSKNKPSKPFVLVVSKSKAGRFYRKYLKSFAVFRFASFYINRLLIKLSEIVVVLSARECGCRYSLISPSLVSQVCGFNSYTLLECYKFNVPPPYIFPGEMFSTFIAADETFPAVRVFEIPNASCNSKSNIIYFDNYAIHHELYNPKSDTTSEELHGINKVSLIDNSLSYKKSLFYESELDVGAVFTDACSHNYAHWISEVLPRITLFCGDKRFESIPIIVDSDLHENMIHSLQIVVGSEREIYFVDKNITLNIKKLFYVDTMGYVPFGRRHVPSFVHSDGFFQPQALDVVRQLHNNIGDVDINPQFPKKIYLRRDGKSRSLINSSDIEKLLVSNGYVPIDTSNMSYMDQVILFRNATHVVGPTGAALANCVFCKPGTHVLVMMGKHSDMIYGYWRYMLSPLGINVSYLVDKNLSTGVFGIHSDYMIDIDEIKSLFRNFENVW